MRAVDYIEAHLDHEIDYRTLAGEACFSEYHFRRIFGMLCGHTVGEYIRFRRLTLAGAEIASGTLNVTEAAFKYGYDSADGFSRAFSEFHGIAPSAAKERGTNLRSFARLTVNKELGGGKILNYRLEERREKMLVGFKSRFCGVPYGKAREDQEERFWRMTRGKQWVLRGASDEPDTIYCIVDSVDEAGYDFYIAFHLDEWDRKALRDPAVTGMDLCSYGFEEICIPAATCAVFETEKMCRPIGNYADIRARVAAEWIPSVGMQLEEGPEVVVMHWKKGEKSVFRYIEINLPVEARGSKVGLKVK